MTEMQFESRMSDSDALMWNIEKDPLLRSTITVVTVLDAVPDRQRLTERIERGSRLIPRMRQRVVSNPLSIAPPRWEIDPNFDLHYHVRWLSAGGGDLRTVLDIAEPMAMQGFDRARPLWEFTVIEGLDGGRAAMVQKLHHAITDGVGGMQIAMLLLDLERNPQAEQEPMPPEPEAKPLGPAERTLDALGHVARRNLGIARRSGATLARALTATATHPGGVGRDVVRTAGSVGRLLAPATEPMSPLMTARSLSMHFDTLSFSLPDLKSAAKAAGGRLNDAFVAGVGGGLHAYHLAHGVEVSQLRMNMPINIRDDDTANVAGNQFVPARFAVPVDIADPVERMQAVNRLVDEQRHEPSLDFVEPLSGVLNRLPTTLTTAVFGAMLKGVDFTASNVPGAPIPVFIAGARLEAMFPFGPPAGAAVNVTLLSSCDDVHIGINADLAAVPDPDVLRTCLQESFEDVLKVA